MLSATKIICIILGIIFLAVGILGRFLSGDIIGLLLVLTAVAIDRKETTHPGTAKSIASIFIVLLGLFSFGVIQFMGTLPNIDTTGATPAGATAIGVVIAGVIIVGGLLLVHSTKRK